MKNLKKKLWKRFLLSYIIVSILPLTIAAYMAVNLISTQIEEQAKITLDKNLDAVSRHFYQRLNHIHFYLNTLSDFLGSELYETETEELREILIDIKKRDNLSFLTVVTPTGQVIARANSDLTGDQVDSGCEASFTGACFKGAAILDCAFLEAENLVDQAMVKNMLEESSPVVEKRGIALASIVPVRNGAEGEIKAYVLGGELLNNNSRKVDQMSDNWQGNVTIFLGNLRVATAVRTDSGQRAVGTVLSPYVEDVVLNQGTRYLGRSTIVDTPHLTAYDPIFSASGDVIGAIFLGIPEEPFLELKREAMLYFFAIAVFGILLAVAISYLVLRSIKKPLQQISQAMKNVQFGDFSHRFKD